MATFAYEAMNSSGQEVKDVIEADSPEKALEKIKGKGLFPTKIREKAQKKSKQKKAAAGVRHASTGMKRNSLCHVADLTFQALDRSQGIGAIPVAERLYQFKITLKDIAPAIWRRIQSLLERLRRIARKSGSDTPEQLDLFRR